MDLDYLNLMGNPIDYSTVMKPFKLIVQNYTGGGPKSPVMNGTTAEFQCYGFRLDMSGMYIIVYGESNDVHDIDDQTFGVPDASGDYAYRFAFVPDEGVERSIQYHIEWTKYYIGGGIIG